MKFAAEARPPLPRDAAAWRDVRFQQNGLGRESRHQRRLYVRARRRRTQPVSCAPSRARRWGREVSSRAVMQDGTGQQVKLVAADIAGVEGLQGGGAQESPLSHKAPKASARRQDAGPAVCRDIASARSSAMVDRDKITADRDGDIADESANRSTRATSSPRRSTTRSPDRSC